VRGISNSHSEPIAEFCNPDFGFPNAALACDRNAHHRYLVRRLWIAGFALVLILAGFFLLAGRQSRELIYEGKPLSQWLDGGYEDSSRALYDVGPPAADSIFAKLKREHPKYGYWGRYRSAWSKVPAFARGLLPRPKTTGFDEWRACNALLAIGPGVIPRLASALRDSSWLVRSTSAQTLGCFQERGSDIRFAVPFLQTALNDPDPATRYLAATVLSQSIN
jgi:hypothetical protein